MGISSRRIARSQKATPFVLGFTKPVLTSPENPTKADNVGAAFGWNGITLTVMNGDQTIPANTTWSDRYINGFVNFTDSTSRLVNSVVVGRAPGGTFRAGLVNGANGGYLERCTLRTDPVSAIYYRNGIHTTGGNWTLVRCDVSRVVDGVHINGAGSVQALGCLFHDYSFWDNDLDQAGDATHPYWSHGDIGIQRLSGNPNTDRYEGCSIQGYFDVTNVVWSGGTWGSGTASGGLIGTPSTALNGGFPNRNYANLISYTNTQPYTGMVFLNNWLDGGNAPSAMIQLTVAGAHSVQIEGNRFGLGGKPSTSSGRMYLCDYASTTTVNFGTRPNVFDDLPNVPSTLRNQPLTFTSTGASIIPANYS